MFGFGQHLSKQVFMIRCSSLLRNFGFVVVGFIYLLVPSWAAQAEGRQTVGWVERVKLYPSNLVIIAKMDTGADSSSLDAQDLEEFDKEGKRWARFTLKNRYGKKSTIEAEVLRKALIKRENGKTSERAVIHVGLCLGETYMETDLNLVNRSHFEYQMLVGRNFLAGNVIIDPGQTYLTEPKCKGAPKS